MSYEDTVLIKLRRDYEKDEVVMFALNKIKELKIEAAKNESYIYELTKQNEDLKAFVRNKNLEKQRQLQIPKELKNLEKSNENKIKNLRLQKDRISKLKSQVKQLKFDNENLKNSKENKVLKLIDAIELQRKESRFWYSEFKNLIGEEEIKKYYAKRDLERKKWQLI